MKFMILMSADPSWEALSALEQTRVIQEHDRFEADLRAVGAFVSSGRFGPDPGLTLVQEADGSKRVIPAPDPGAGAIGGYYIVDVEDMNQALTWASRCRFIAGRNWIYPFWEE